MAESRNPAQWLVTGSEQRSLAHGPQPSPERLANRGPSAPCSFWSAEQINAFPRSGLKGTVGIQTVEVINQNGSVFVTHSHPPKSTCSTSQVSHNTRHLKFPAGEFPAAGSDVPKNDLGRVRVHVHTRVHTHIHAHARLAGYGFGAVGRRAVRVDALPAAIPWTPARVTGMSGWGGPPRLAGPHSRNFEMSSTTSWSCLEMLISRVVLELLLLGRLSMSRSREPSLRVSLCRVGGDLWAGRCFHGDPRCGKASDCASRFGSCFQQSRTKCGFCPLLPINARFKIKSFWRESEVTAPLILLGHRREPLG